MYLYLPQNLFLVFRKSRKNYYVKILRFKIKFNFPDFEQKYSIGLNTARFLKLKKKSASKT